MSKRVWIWMVLAMIGAAGLRAQAPSSAPLNPDFLRYLEQRELALADPQYPAAPGEPENYGLVPPPTELPQVPEDQVPGGEPKAFPARYDLRTLGKVTPVRDQGTEGACWAFATYGSMESCLLTAETWDFSENNLVNLHGFDNAFNDGGNADMAIAYLARWAGPVLESEDPYPRPGQSPTTLQPRKHLQAAYLFPRRTSYTANSVIKQALMDHGGVYTHLYANNTYLNSATAAYYYNGLNTPNHAVTIIGWDDNYSKANFKTPPPGNGAFIAKNSWGVYWGQSGYFYISYYDTQVAANSAVFVRPETTANYTRKYEYDPLGAIRWLGYDNGVCWGANIFTAAAASESLRAVSFHTPIAGTRADIYVYTGVAAGSPRSGSLRTSRSATLTYAGYHTLALPVAVSLTAGQRFSVAIKFTTPGYKWQVGYESPIAGYSSRATASPGQSYYSPNGSAWEDMCQYPYKDNVCIKAFAGTGSGPTPPPPATPGTPLLADYDGDGKADPALFRADGSWRALLSGSGYGRIAFQSIYSGSQFVPVPGDFDGDRRADPAALDKSSGFYRYYSSRYGYRRYYIPVNCYRSGFLNTAGDFDGDGEADPVAYLPSAAQSPWYVLLSGAGYGRYWTINWGGPNWVPFCCDYDGDRRGDLIGYSTAVYYWYVLLSGSGYRRSAQHQFGAAGYLPACGDFDGDRRADFALYNPASGQWTALLSGMGYRNPITATWNGN